MVLGWAHAAGFAGSGSSFVSRLPDEDDLEEESDAWFKNAAENILQNQQTQMLNMSTAINQTFYNKVVKQTQTVMTGLGTLDKFRPEIANMAAGHISGMNMSIGGILDKGIGVVQGATQGASQGALGAVEGVMMSAISGLSAITAINPIVGAVAAIGFAIAKAASAEAERRRVQRTQKENAFYKDLLPFPTFDKSGDELAMNKVLAAMPTNDWTSLFIPRYDPAAEWQGAMRQDGFEFFPGDSTGIVQAEPRQLIYPGTGMVGLGMIPGTQQVTGTLQSRLTASQIQQAMQFIPKGEVDTLWEWAQLQAPTTIGQGAVDSGDYYPSSAQTMSFLWGHIQTQGASGNPDLYKLNCPYISEQWRQYCLGAWAYLEEHCSWDAYTFDMKGKSMQKHIDEGWKFNDRLRAMEAQHSCIIACLLGVYRCYSPELGGGLMPGNQYRQGLGSRACQTNFNSFPTNCRQSIYEAYIKDRVNDLLKMQYDMLSASLVCAYVRSDYAAFNTIGTFDGGQSIALRQKLDAMRDLLLDRPDQWKHLVEANVPRDEVHRGSNWYQTLKDAGAFEGNMGLKGSSSPGGSSANYGQGGLNLQAGNGFNEPAPPVMQLVGRIPGQELVEQSRSSSNKGIVLLAAAALGIMMMKNKR
jgi:hypothetical protein